MNCECDYDYQGEEDGYVKTSRYCPEHDECESCMDGLGVVKDPLFDKATEKRAAWICAACVEADRVEAAGRNS
jgi:hypothetical protein